MKTLMKLMGVVNGRIMMITMMLIIIIMKIMMIMIMTVQDMKMFPRV